VEHTGYKGRKRNLRLPENPVIDRELINEVRRPHSHLKQKRCSAEWFRCARRFAQIFAAIHQRRVLQIHVRLASRKTRSRLRDSFVWSYAAYNIGH